MNFSKHLLIAITTAISVFGATAPDFKAVDTKGVEHQLYKYLESGKYVLIEFGAIN